MTPDLLLDGLKSLKRDDIKVYINHIKPSYEEKIIKEITTKARKIGILRIEEKEFVKF
ncbi:MAG: hypothetical protein ABGW74_09395 [Campylobacterales bacterium]